MGLYGRYLLPRIVHLTCSAKPNMRQRQKLVPLEREGPGGGHGVGSSVRAEALHERFEARLNRLALGREYFSLLKEIGRKQASRQAEHSAQVKAAITRKQRSLEARKEKLLEAYLY